MKEIMQPVVNVAGDVVTITFPLSSVVIRSTSELELEKLKQIADLASKSVYQLRRNNKLWANAFFRDLETLMQEAGIYVPPVTQG